MRIEINYKPKVEHSTGILAFEVPYEWCHVSKNKNTYLRATSSGLVSKVIIYKGVGLNTTSENVGKLLCFRSVTSGYIDFITLARSEAVLSWMMVDSLILSLVGL